MNTISDRFIFILGFRQSCDQNKNRNHSMKKVKSLRYDRWFIYKQPCQESGLCCFSFTRYLQKCVTQIYRALYGNVVFVSFWGTQTWRPLSNRNICHWVLLLKRKIIAPELQHIERNASSSASTVQLAKTKVITHLLTYATAFSGRNFHVTQRKKLGNSNAL